MRKSLEARLCWQIFIDSGKQWREQLRTDPRSGIPRRCLGKYGKNCFAAEQLEATVADYLHPRPQHVSPIPITVELLRLQIEGTRRIIPHCQKVQKIRAAISHAQEVYAYANRDDGSIYPVDRDNLFDLR